MGSRFDVLGVNVDPITSEIAVERVVDSILGRSNATVVFCTVSTIVNAQDDPALREALKEATLVAPDGMPLVWLGRKAGFPVERVYGPDFMIDFFQCTGSRFSHFFYGAAPGVAEEMAARLSARFPGLRVAGTASPPQDLDPYSLPESDLRSMNDAKPDIVWIALGHPKQEIFMHANRSLFKAPVLAAVGAAFDFHSGRKREAPDWMKRCGLQWLHRLAREPRRLWRRYLIGNARFVILLLLEWRKTDRAR